jgi:hypothetical protein
MVQAEAEAEETSVSQISEFIQFEHVWYIEIMIYIHYYSCPREGPNLQVTRKYPIIALMMSTSPPYNPSRLHGAV